jgi:hypothetical protein
MAFGKEAVSFDDIIQTGKPRIRVRVPAHWR